MLYILVFDHCHCLEFYVLECARVYQLSHGGDIFAVAMDKYTAIKETL